MSSKKLFLIPFIKPVILVIVALASIAVFKYFGPNVFNDSLEFKSLEDAKVFFESKRLHCRLTKDGLNVSMIVMDKPFTMTLQEEDAFHIAVHQNKISGGFLLIQPTNVISKMESLSSAQQWGNTYAVGDKHLIRRIELQFR